MLTREQLQRAATDWRTVSAAAVTTTVDDVKCQLLPMLRQDIRPDGGDVER